PHRTAGTLLPQHAER
ncbi:protein ImpB, partial [Escherichia coli EC1865]